MRDCALSAMIAAEPGPSDTAVGIVAILAIFPFFLSDNKYLQDEADAIHQSIALRQSSQTTQSTRRVPHIVTASACISLDRCR